MNILMIGNSLCYYYVEELYGMLEATGIKANVCNVYYSGCSIAQHWAWWKSGEANYDFFVTNENGRVKTTSTDLEWCLQQQNWDVNRAVGLHQRAIPYVPIPVASDLGSPGGNGLLRDGIRGKAAADRG